MCLFFSCNVFFINNGGEFIIPLTMTLKTFQAGTHFFSLVNLCNCNIQNIVMALSCVTNI